MHRIVRETLEDFRDVGDPEGTLEAPAYLLESLAETHSPPHGSAAIVLEAGKEASKAAGDKEIVRWEG